MVISDEDVDWLASLQWVGTSGRHHRWYCRYRGERKSFLLHREVAKRAGLRVDGLQVDHIDRDINNNQRDNLRLATPGQNRANSSSRNKTGFKGVRFRTPKELGYRKRRCEYTPRWMAQITIDGKKVWLGDFETPEKAHAAYLDAAIKAKGEFACGG